jgi:hypothetical protein
VVPASVTREVAEAERGALEAWAGRRGWAVELDLESLRLVAMGTHPGDGAPIVVVADLTGYRAVPPAWRFVDPVTREPSPGEFPRAGQITGGGSSIFHESSRVICASWNKLAYQEEGGPHGDWGGTTSWLGVQAGSAASMLADMLATIDIHLRASPGRMG